MHLVTRSIHRCQEIDHRLIKLIWKHRPQTLQTTYTGENSRSITPLEPSDYKLFIGEKATPTDDALVTVETEKDGVNKRRTRETKRKEEKDTKKANTKKSFFGWKTEKKGKDIEADKPAQRPTKLFAPIYNGIGAGVCLCESLSPYYRSLSNHSTPDLAGDGVQMLLIEYFMDKDPIRFALIVTLPFLFCVSLVRLSSDFVIPLNLGSVLRHVYGWHPYEIHRARCTIPSELKILLGRQASCEPSCR